MRNMYWQLGNLGTILAFCLGTGKPNLGLCVRPLIFGLNLRRLELLKNILFHKQYGKLERLLV